jgi:hypothetical protein
LQYFCFLIIKLCLLLLVLLRDIDIYYYLQSLLTRIRMRINFTTLLNYLEIHQYIFIILYNTISYSLLDYFFLLIHTRLQILILSKLMLKHLLSKKSDKLLLSHKLIIYKVNFITEILKFVCRIFLQVSICII